MDLLDKITFVLGEEKLPKDRYERKEFLLKLWKKEKKKKKKNDTSRTD